MLNGCKTIDTNGALTLGEVGLLVKADNCIMAFKCIDWFIGFNR